MSDHRLITQDVRAGLAGLPEESVDLICTDPPYGYSFMGKDWDKAVPPVEVWRECLRVLKAGAFAFVMSSPRQDVLSRMIVNLQDAGFVTGFTSIYWCYASGFPKASNIGKMVDKRAGVQKPKMIPTKKSNKLNQEGEISCGATGFTDISEPITPEALALDGSYGGFQPKPAVEVILVVMKPLSEKTYVDQALKNRKGITWLDGGRIPFVNSYDEKHQKDMQDGQLNAKRGIMFGGVGKSISSGNLQGRFPANLLVSDDALNDGIGTKSGLVKEGYKRHINSQFAQANESALVGYPDSGSFSRYFDLDKWFDERIEELPESVRRVFPFLIVPKASKAEKNKGLEQGELQQVNDGRNIPPDNAFQRGATLRRNIHPTCKPVKLMSYLITIGSREGDLVCDPFCGSGTTLIAAELLKRRSIGIDDDAEYIKIAEQRLAAMDNQGKLV